ncbi:MAG: adenylate/guanylate cyclase domain-containing protein [Magnetococcales bacterium]|nr:adenylate/guanylate cyclase domain-containing protein [Magnetococcales bacterium]
MGVWCGGTRCYAALACQRLLAEQAPAWSQARFPAFPTHMGLCSGEVIVGNMGYKDCLSYTVIGDTVNLASRLESLNKYYGTRIVIGESTQAQVDASMVTRFLDVVAVKGKSQGVRIYELVEERGRVTAEALQFVERYNDGMRFYLDRQWQRAAGLFSACLEERPQDRPADMLLVRCREYEVQSPPTDWRGVTIMKEK